MFNSKTRNAIRQNEAGFGNALAGRGPQLNEAIGALRSSSSAVSRPCATWSPRNTNFGGFLACARGPLRDGRPGGRVPTRASSSPSTRPSPPSPGYHGPTSRKRSPRVPRPSTPRMPTCPYCGRSCTNPSASSPPLDRGQGARRNLADDRRRAACGSPGPERLAGVLRPVGADRRSAARLPEGHRAFSTALTC